MAGNTRTMIRTSGLGLLIGGLLASVLLLPPPARAAVTDPGVDPDGYRVEVRVRLTGEAAPGGSGGGSVTASVKPTCWWDAADGPYTDAVAMLAWYEETTGGAQTGGTIGEFGPRRIWEEAAEAAAAGTAMHWYRAFCLDPEDYDRYDAGSTEEIPPIFGGQPFVTFYYRAFEAGAPIPPPLVDPFELALVARDQMVIPFPETERNPRIAAAGAPTLVGLPTWFWVPEAQALGGGDGELDITASLGEVSATVTATTGGLTLTSPGGGAECDPARALVKYAEGTAESSACTVQFSRASVGYPDGYPVNTSTLWQATWEGQDADGAGDGGTLDPLARTTSVNVPVAEVQNIVTAP